MFLAIFVLLLLILSTYALASDEMGDLSPSGYETSSEAFIEFNTIKQESSSIVIGSTSSSDLASATALSHASPESPTSSFDNFLSLFSSVDSLHSNYVASTNNSDTKLRLNATENANEPTAITDSTWSTVSAVGVELGETFQSEQDCSLSSSGDDLISSSFNHASSEAKSEPFGDDDSELIEADSNEHIDRNESSDVTNFANTKVALTGSLDTIDTKQTSEENTSNTADIIDHTQTSPSLVCTTKINIDCSTHTGDIDSISLTSTSEEITTTSDSISKATRTNLEIIFNNTVSIANEIPSNETANFENITNLHELNETNLTLEVYQINFDDPLKPIENNLGYNNSINELHQDTNTSVDDCHFMSFEEWKKQKENSTSQAKSIVNNKTNNSSNLKHEVDIVEDPGKDLAIINTTKPVDQVKKLPPKLQDQGKLYKSRFNYASVDCAATIVKTNSDAKGASSILMENKESYLLNKCSSPNKFVIIELCQDILVENIVIGNFEFFSSTFKDIRVSVSERFPTSNWQKLGDFEAKNIRDVQSFSIENPLIWAKYLKLEILSHYGEEFYCPISIVRVHGKSVMDEVKEDKESEPIEEDPTDLVEPLRLSNTMGLDNNTFDQCRVLLPHLQLSDFLHEINSTYEYCEVQETAPPTRSTQESFYKNIMKRLSLLESNATLSLLYIEEQSKLLSQAFTNLERRQSSNFKGLIQSFNHTILDQLTNFKSSYVHMHNEYAKLFKIQQHNHENMLMDSKSRISTLSRELTFQRGISIFNSIIVICLLIYLVFTRQAYIDDYNRTPKSPVHVGKKPFIVGSFKKSSYPNKKRR